MKDTAHGHYFLKEYTCTANTVEKGPIGFTRYWFEAQAACNITLRTAYSTMSAQELAPGEFWYFEGPCLGFSVSASTKVTVFAV